MNYNFTLQKIIHSFVILGTKFIIKKLIPVSNPIFSIYNKKYKMMSMLRIKVEKIKIEKFILEFMLF